MPKQELTFSQVKKILGSEFINRSHIASLMYPGILKPSATGKLHNKLYERGRFKLTEVEQKQLIKIVSREYFKLLE